MGNSRTPKKTYRDMVRFGLIICTFLFLNCKGYRNAQYLDFSGSEYSLNNLVLKQVILDYIEEVKLALPKVDVIYRLDYKRVRNTDVYTLYYCTDTYCIRSKSTITYFSLNNELFFVSIDQFDSFKINDNFVEKILKTKFSNRWKNYKFTGEYPPPNLGITFAHEIIVKQDSIISFRKISNFR